MANVFYAFSTIKPKIHVPKIYSALFLIAISLRLTSIEIYLELVNYGATSGQWQIFHR